MNFDPNAAKISGHPGYVRHSFIVLNFLQECTWKTAYNQIFKYRQAAKMRPTVWKAL